MKRFRRVAAAALVVAVIGWLPLVHSTPAVAQSGSPLVTETFTGATADPRFEGFGSACLTGAPAGATPGPGDHPLGSCPASRVGPVPPAGGAPFGYLQLTDASTNQAGAVLFNQPIPANQGVEISFEQWQYGSTTPATPADGISFFLVDGAGGLTAPGAFGGSLGYAQKLPDDNPANPFLPGVDNGYLGIGLDTLGNYFGDWEHRGNGCEQRSPAGTAFRVPAPGQNMITVRGPGNGTDGYCFLTATTNNFTTTGPWPSTLPGQLQGPLTSLPPGVTPAQAQTLLEPSKRTVTVRITPAPNPQVTVDVDFNDGTGPHRVLNFAAPQNVPPTYKLGFAASTGGFTDVHLIRNVQISSLLPLPQLNLVKQVVIDPPLPPVIGVGTSVPYQFVVTNTGNAPISQLVVIDPNFTSIACPTTTLAPDETTVCTASYVVTQADVDRGIVVNTAVASGTSAGGPVTSPESEATLPLGSGTPALSLSKVADPSSVSAAGQQVAYRYVVTNTGTVTINGLAVADTVFTGTGTPPVITCPTTTVAPGDQVTCTGTYTVNQDDINAGTTISNTATATGTAPDGTTATSPPATATVDITAAASLALVKSVSPSTVSTAGQSVTYSFLATNNGQVTLTGLAVDDISFTGTGPPPVVTCPVTTLAPGASTTCTGTYTITQADIDAGGVTNTATVTGTSPGGPTTSPPSTAVVDTTAAPGLSLTKIADPDSVSAAGQQVAYRYVVTNSGDVTLTGLTVTDTAFSGTGTPPVITCPVTTLTPGAQTTCTGTYTITEADVDAGTVTNTATATGTAPGGTPVTSPPSTATVTIPAAPTLALVKSADPPAVTAPGQQVTYTFLVTNTGNVSLTNVAVADVSFSGSGPLPPTSCPTTSLAPGAQVTCTTTYTVTQADMDAGSISNSAVANATAPGGTAVVSPPSNAIVTTAQTPALSLAKSVDPASVANAGQVVTYSFAVTNTGNVTITGVTVDEVAFSGSGNLSPISCPPAAGSLAPGDATTCTATYTVTQADIDAGSITNTATATGTGPTGATVTTPPSSAVVGVTGTAALALVKTADPATVTAAGQQVHYTFVVTNTGSLSITGLTVTDVSFTGTGTPPTISCPTTTLAPGDQVTCAGTYTTTQADIDAGTDIVDTATATGTDSAGNPATSPPSTATVHVAATPSLALVKSVNPSTVTAAGQVVTYSFLIINNGDLTITGLAVDEVSFTGSGALSALTCPVTALPPGASTTCTATYTVTQADIDAGGVADTATATGTNPAGDPVVSPPSSAVVDVTVAPALSLTKVADPASVSASGQQVAYTYVVTNTGDLTITGVTVADVSFTGTGTPPAITCPTTTLAPGAQATCTATYPVTQADLDAGTGITDTAVARGATAGGQQVVSNDATATVDVTSAPSLVLVKSVSPQAATAAGQVVTYSFAATNNGNLTLTGLTIGEVSFTGTGTLSPVTCPVTILAPGHSTTCTATYTVTQADIDTGSITNTATATGAGPAGDPVASPPSTAIVDVTAAATLSLTKQATPSSVTEAGQQITYQYVVTNTGDLTLTGLTVTDTAFSGTGTPPVISCPATTLAPGDQATCTATYTTTQADIDAGTAISNTAAATGTDPAGQPATSNQATADVDITRTPSLAMVKSVGPSTVTAAGQTITYSFLAINNGNTTIGNLAINEVSFTGTGTLSAISCPIRTLAPAASTTCTATYAVTQADVNAGSITNTATATGTDTAGHPVVSPPSNASVDVTVAAALSLTKVAIPSNVSAAGQQITYQYVVTNTGDLTLTGVSVADTAFSGTGTPPVITCPVTTLAPADQMTCTGTYTVTQADADTGSITNTAVATGTAPDGTTTTSPPSTAVVDITATPQLGLVKSADPPTVTGAGQLITYHFLVSNTGNVTITALAVQETSFSGSGTPSAITCPTTTLTPGQRTTCTSTYTITQADMDAGNISDTAVATGTDPAGDPTTSPPSTAVVDTAASPGVTVTKTADPTTVTAAGQQITFSYVVTNTGTVTLTGITINEVNFTGTGPLTGPTCPAAAASLAPGASVTCTATYTTTAQDLTTNAITNTATATGTAPDGDTPTSPPSTTTVDVAGQPAITLTKSATPATITAAGQQITYSFLITNTGTVPLTNATVTEQTFTGTGPLSPITCPAAAANLAAGASVTCTATYTTTQTDIDAGQITNTATATGTPPAGLTPPDSDPSTATVGFTGITRLGLTKTGHAVDVNGDHRVDAGDRIDWTLTVTNLGATTLNNITASDPLAGTATCPATQLAPGASMTCTVPPHTITAADAAAGRVTNTATATGTTGNGTPITSDPAHATITISSSALPVTGRDLSRIVVTGLLSTLGGVLILLASIGLVRRRSR